ncbi:hypothetical protein ON010_g6140 [Phytophthora cinnamomi]|nr:hypothetical protein ON010_g6140 [Phytophthora cinnamomi]
MDQQQTSEARAFFLTHKDLFQYEKYVGNQDPLRIEAADEDRHGGVAKSFLEQYRDIDRGRPAVALSSELHFPLLHPPPRNYSIGNAIDTSTNAPPALVALQSPAFMSKSSNPQCQLIRSCALGNSPLRVSCHARPEPTNNSMVTKLNITPPQQSPTPDCVSASMIMSDQFISRQQQRSLVRVPVVSKQQPFSLPTLAELLIDRETRAAATAHKTWDEAHKIEVLIGSKCAGRVSAASRNIPQSIRLRLRASANVSVRREHLYDLLRSDYEEISKY